MPWPEESDPSRIFAETLEQVQYAEELGFCSAWFAEHHFSRYSMGSSSLVVAGAAAALTNTIRLATGVLVPTLHNPIRLAEDTATVDHISGGRLDVGFGRGFTGYEYSGFNIATEDSQERFPGVHQSHRGPVDDTGVLFFRRLLQCQQAEPGSTAPSRGLTHRSMSEPPARGRRWSFSSRGATLFAPP